jgi:hypothetical protein
MVSWSKYRDTQTVFSKCHLYPSTVLREHCTIYSVWARVNICYRFHTWFLLNSRNRFFLLNPSKMLASGLSVSLTTSWQGSEREWFSLKRIQEGYKTCRLCYLTFFMFHECLATIESDSLTDTVSLSTRHPTNKQNFPHINIGNPEGSGRKVIYEWLTASSYITKFLRISSYIRKAFLRYDFATAPIWNSLYMRKISFSFLSVYPPSGFHRLTHT